MLKDKITLNKKNLKVTKFKCQINRKRFKFTLTDQENRLKYILKGDRKRVTWEQERLLIWDIKTVKRDKFRDL